MNLIIVIPKELYGKKTKTYKILEKTIYESE